MDYVWDVECFPNLWSATFENMVDDKDVHQFVIWYHPIQGQINQYSELMAFIKQKNIQLIGYNNLKYDNPMLAYLQYDIHNFHNLNDMLFKCYCTSQELVTNNDFIMNDKLTSITYWKHSFTSMDIMKILRHDALKKSLKQTLINIKYPIIQSLPLPYDKNIEKDEIKDILEYNLNDVKGTKALTLFIQDEIAIRYSAVNKYRCFDMLNVSRAGLANKMLAIKYAEMSGDDYNSFKNIRSHCRNISIGNIIDRRITFKTPEFKALYDKLNNTIITNTNEIDFSIKVKDTIFNIKSGGLHSEDKPGIFQSDKNNLIRDADVQSFYPRNIINLTIAPKLLNKYAFVESVRAFTDERLVYKELGKHNKEAKAFDKALKNVIVSIFGGFNSEYKFWYDRECLVKTTINGQLYLISLIEDLHINDFEVISANTDGIVTKIPKNRESLYNDICKKWENKYEFILEYNDYIKYIRRDVNCYIAVNQDGTVKYKGDLNPDNYMNYHVNGSFPGYDRPIVALAIARYFTDDIPVEETIRFHSDIYDFCTTQKADKKFQFELHSAKDGRPTIELLQKDLRFFISNSGGKLIKAAKDKTVETRKITRLFSEYLITPFNNYYKTQNMSEYNINYTHYIIEAKKIIIAIKSGSTNKKIIQQNLGIYKIPL